MERRNGARRTCAATRSDAFFCFTFSLRLGHAVNARSPTSTVHTSRIQIILLTAPPHCRFMSLRPRLLRGCAMQGDREKKNRKYNDSLWSKMQYDHERMHNVAKKKMAKSARDVLQKSNQWPSAPKAASDW